MKIKTITCHNVYNVGASLQAYALVSYIKGQGHEVEIIDYNPYYLRHYELTGVRNPRFDKPLLRNIYQVLKFPGRLKERYSGRKQVFDLFTKKYLPRTSENYRTFEDLLNKIPEADVYIAGSDQIWNPVFENGKDPSFFLEFVPKNKKKMSYAASFAVDKLSNQDFDRMKHSLESFDAISIREKSGVSIVEKMGLSAIQTCDPVFLLSKDEWQSFVKEKKEQNYIFVYDFDGNQELWSCVIKLASEQNLTIISAFPHPSADVVAKKMGPIEFVNYIANAQLVISNSFHATAFSIIFEKDFLVFNRKEKINTRMRDLLDSLNIHGHLLSSIKDMEMVKDIIWNITSENLEKMKNCSASFLYDNLK